MAGVKPGDFDHIMLYDAFTSGPPIMLEALGLCKPAKACISSEEGRSTRAASSLSTPMAAASPTRTPACTGSFPSSSPCGSFRAKRGAPGADVKLGLVNGMGGMLSAAGTLVLSTQASDPPIHIRHE